MIPVLAEIDTLPSAEIEPPMGYRYRYRVSQQ